MPLLRSSLGIVIAASLFGLGVACTGEDPAVSSTPPTGGDGGTPDVGPSTGGSFTLRAPAGSAIVSPNESVKVAIEVERTGGFTGAVKIVLQPVPAGIAVAPLTLTGDATKGELTITAEAAAKDTITRLQLVATADPGLSDTKELPFVVRGAASKREMTYGDKDGLAIVTGFYPQLIERTADDGVVIANAEAIIRIFADGKRDTTFGTAGKTVFKQPSGRTVSLRVAKDGKLLVFTYTSDRKYVAVHRLLPNGAYDTTYGAEGVATYDFATPADQPYVFGGDVDADGRAVIGLVPGLTSTSLFIRFLADGKLDTVFNGENRSTTSGGWRELRVQGETPIAFGSGFYDSGTERSKFALALATKPASPPVELPGEAYIPDVSRATFDSKGRILVAGALVETGQPEQVTNSAAIVRVKSDGTPDPTFGMSQYVSEYLDTAQGSHPTFVVALEEPVTGKVIAIGQRLKYSNPDTYVRSHLLARYSELGAPDPTFGNAGILLEDIPNATEPAGGYLQTIPTIVVVRRAEPSDTVLSRYWR